MPALRKTLTRRKLLKYSLAAGGAAALASLIDAWFIEPTALDAHEVVLPIADLPGAWHNLRIAHLTDLHFGNRPGLDYFRHVIDVTNSLKPDIAVLTGDYSSGSHGINDDLRALIANLQTPLGTFAVMGNHDYDNGIVQTCRLLIKANVHVLTNERVILSRGGQSICLAGLDDLWHGTINPTAALKGLPAGMPAIVLAHNPDWAENVPLRLRADLMLCGHTHGGQVCLPFIGPIITANDHRKYASGLAQGPHGHVYTSRGIGMGGRGLRFFCPPELPIVRLVQA